MKLKPILNRFNFGEVSPLLCARGDLAKYAAGCRTLLNFIPLLQGPVQRRGGTRFVARAGNGDQPVALIDFAFSETTTYVIEAGDGYLRFFYQGAPVMSGGQVYQISSPWAQADLFLESGVCALKYVQSGDVMYVVCPNRPPRKLMRHGHTDWRIEPLPGWGDRPNPTAIALFRERLVLAADQTVYLSQSGAFDNFELPVAGIPGAEIVSYRPEYRLVVDAAAGTVTSTESSHVITVGFKAEDVEFNKVSDYKVLVTAKDPKKGLGRIGVNVTTAFTVHPNSVLGTVLVKSGNNNFIQVTVDPNKSSIAYDPAVDNYKGYLITKATNVVAADDPIEVNVYSEQMDKIQWLCPSNSLLVGTTGGEFMIGETTSVDPLGPENIKVVPETAFGSSPIQALRIGSVVLFVQRAGRKVREFVYDYSGDGYSAMDVTVAAEHITRGGLTALAWQSEPIETLWATRPDGQLLGFTYCREQDMTAWHRHQLGGGGRVSHLAVIPAFHGGRDELWLSVRREIEGRTVHYIEVLDPGHDPEQDQTECFYVDSGLTVRGSRLTEITGLEHLEGHEVAILADGGVQPRQVVAGGRVPLQYPADLIQVGLPYDSVLATVNLEAQLSDGSAQGRLKRFTRLHLRLVDSAGGAAGPDLDHLAFLEYRTGMDRTDQARPLFNGDKTVNWPGGYDTAGVLTVAQTHPLPFTLAAVIPEVAVGGAE